MPQTTIQVFRAADGSIPRTGNFADVIRDRLKMDTDLALAVEQESINVDIAGEIYRARTEAKMTQRELARRVGTYQSVIARMEDADYEGHSVTMLRKIASALGKRMHVEFFDALVEDRKPGKKLKRATSSKR